MHEFCCWRVCRGWERTRWEQLCTLHFGCEWARREIIDCICCIFRSLKGLYGLWPANREFHNPDSIQTIAYWIPVLVLLCTNFPFTTVTPGVGDGQEGWSAAVHAVSKSRTYLIDWTELNWMSPCLLHYIIPGYYFFPCVSNFINISTISCEIWTITYLLETQV